MTTTTNIEHYEKKQLIEETLFDHYASVNNIKKYVFTPLNHSYDVKMRSGQTYFIAETKVRQEYSSDFFLKHGPYLEFIKGYQMDLEKRFIKRIKKTEVKMLYYNFSSDGLQIYEIEDLWNYKFDWKLLPKDNVNKELVWKMVTELKNPIETLKLNTNDLLKNI